MKRRRRLVLQSLTTALLPAHAGAAALRSDVGAGSHSTVRSLLDTLIPGDAAPAASAVGVDRALMTIARGSGDYLKLLEDGAAWLDETARALGAKSFALATEAQRIAVVRQAEGARAGTLPRRLFRRVRQDAMRLYYADPATWSAVGYAGPPQPAGFLDFESRPATGK